MLLKRYFPEGISRGQVAQGVVHVAPRGVWGTENNLAIQDGGVVIA